MPARLTAALAAQGVVAPFPIQATQPDALADRDVLGRGRTGVAHRVSCGTVITPTAVRSGRAWAVFQRAGVWLVAPYA